MARRGVALVGVVLALSGGLGTALAQDPDGDGGDVGGPPLPPPPPADPAAGPPVYVAGHQEDRALLLDAQGRVARVLPDSAGDRVLPCPGGRRLVDASDYFGAVHVRRLDGRTLWRQRIPYRYVAGVACLDPRGRRVAVVTESERTALRTLRILTRNGARTVLRTRHETPLLTRDRLYLTGSEGTEVRALPSGRRVRTLPLPPSAHQVLTSPGGRRFAMTHFTKALRDRSWLVDARTRSARRIAIPRVTVLGWLAKNRLAVRSDGHLRVLDLRLRERRAVSGFRPVAALITGEGDVVGEDRSALVTVRRGSDRVEQIGTLPDGVYLIASLR